MTHYRCLTDDTRSNDFTNGILSPATYFRMLANKAPIGMAVMELDNAPFEGDVNVPAEIGPMNHAYNALLPAMQVRTLHEDGSVEWYDPETGERALFGVRAASPCRPASGPSRSMARIRFWEREPMLSRSRSLFD